MKISIQGLKQGLSQFLETVPNDFLLDQYQKFYPFDFNIRVDIDKFERDFKARIFLKSNAHYICDSCLKEFEKEVESLQEYMFEIGSEPEGGDEEIAYLSPDITELDISELLNEGVLLIHPIKMVCSNECKGLCPGCGVDLNIEECKCSGEGTDPRWDALRKLIK